MCEKNKQTNHGWMTTRMDCRTRARETSTRGSIEGADEDEGDT